MMSQGEGDDIDGGRVDVPISPNSKYYYLTLEDLDNVADYNAQTDDPLRHYANSWHKNRLIDLRRRRAISTCLKVSFVGCTVKRSIFIIIPGIYISSSI